VDWTREGGGWGGAIERGKTGGGGGAAFVAFITAGYPTKENMFAKAEYTA